MHSRNSIHLNMKIVGPDYQNLCVISQILGEKTASGTVRKLIRKTHQDLLLDRLIEKQGEENNGTNAVSQN